MHAVIAGIERQMAGRILALSLGAETTSASGRERPDREYDRRYW
jgi:hypothetical protein